MMDERVINSRLMVLGVMVFALLVAWWPDISLQSIGSPVCDPTMLCVVFLDVGQGDAILAVVTQP